MGTVKINKQNNSHLNVKMSEKIASSQERQECSVAKEKHFANSYLLKMLPFLLRRCLRRIPVQAGMIFFSITYEISGGYVSYRND
jgi:hypothetical protein